MKNLIKKLVCVLLICASLIGITSCNNTNTGEPTGEDATYPLMDYFENKVYAVKYFDSARTRDNIFDNNEFTAVGTTTMANIINKGVYNFGKSYGGLCFTAKTGVEIEEVTFTITTAKTSYYNVYFGGMPEFDGNKYSYTNAIAGDYYGNHEVSGDKKVIKLNAGEELTITLKAVNGRNGDAFGKITEEYNKKPQNKRIFIVIDYIIFSDEKYPYLTASTGTISAERLEELGCRIYNVNFKCKKI